MDTKFTSLFFKMKRFKNTVLLFCCFAFTTQLCEAQPYESIFGKDSTSFFIVRPDLKGYAPEYFTHINGLDTLINNTEYVVFSSDYYGSLFLREDSANANVYLFDENFNTEKVIMDLNLTTGDSFYLGYDTSETQAYHKVDSVYYLNGIKHVRLNHEIFGKNEKLLFVEGVGPTNGLSYKKSVDYFGSYLICSWKNDSNIFTSNYYNGDCDPDIIGSTGNKSQNKNTVSLYPNPVRNEAFIEFTSEFDLSQNLEIRIFNATGQQVKTHKVHSSKTRISRDHLPSGLYLIQISNSREVIKTFKAVFQ